MFNYLGIYQIVFQSGQHHTFSSAVSEGFKFSIFFFFFKSLFHSHFFKQILFIYFKQRGREEERERNINVWLLLLLTCPPANPTGDLTWPATQACALTGNQIGDPLVHQTVLNPLSHTSQGFHFHLRERGEGGKERERKKERQTDRQTLI